MCRGQLWEGLKMAYNMRSNHSKILGKEKNNLKLSGKVSSGSREKGSQTKETNYKWHREERKEEMKRYYSDFTLNHQGVDL